MGRTGLRPATTWSGSEEVKRLVEFALRDLQIEKLRERAPQQLSGGEKKRVALASVLGLSPDVWLLDEPSAGLDPRSLSWLLDFINQQGKAKENGSYRHARPGYRGIDCRACVCAWRGSPGGCGRGLPNQILANKALLVSSCLMQPSGSGLLLIALQSGPTSLTARCEFHCRSGW